jgi:hypothetical protein
MQVKTSWFKAGVVAGVMLVASMALAAQGDTSGAASGKPTTTPGTAAQSRL